MPTRTKQKAANAAKQVAAHLLRFALQCEREEPLEPRPAMAAHQHAANLLSFRERCQRDGTPDPHPRMRPSPMNMARRAAVSATAEAVNDVRVGVLTTPYIGSHDMPYTLRTELCVRSGVLIPLGVSGAYCVVQRGQGERATFTGCACCT